jgi:hypothetical protein
VTPGFPLACNLANPCLGHKPKAKVTTSMDYHKRDSKKSTINQF